MPENLHQRETARAADAPELSVVVPCYNEGEALEAFFQRIEAVLRDLGLPWELLCVNDGSTDRTLDLLIAKARNDARIKIADLSRNFGKEAALTAGLEMARGRAVVVIDADLQDPPEVIPVMLEKWRGGYDVVYAARSARACDSLMKKTTAGLFYRLYNSMTTVPIPANAGDFRLMDRRVVDALNRLPERNRFMKGLFSWLGFKQAEVRYERPAREAGESKFNYWKLWNFALDGLTSFTTLPLRVWTYVGGAIAAFSVLYALFLIARTLIYGIDMPGYASIMVVMLFLGSVQLISLGVIGEYLGRTYHEVKQRPVYLIDRVYDFETAAEGSAPTESPAPQRFKAVG